MSYLTAAFLHFLSLVCLGFGGAFNHTGQIFHIWAQRKAMKIDEKYVEEQKAKKPKPVEIPVTDGWVN